MQKHKKQLHGFTLIEVMMGILSGILVGCYKVAGLQRSEIFQKAMN